MTRDHAASIRSRLLALARDQGEDFQRLLIRYAIERLLFRLSRSPHEDDFILKGATLFALWFGSPHRPTKDLDLHGRGEPDMARLVDVFREVVAVECKEDGVVFDDSAVSGAPIRDEARYAGFRIIVPGDLAGARFKVQIDIGLGDAVVPPPRVVTMTSLLDLPAPRLWGYARETVVAEKLEALVLLGLTTSRMKDLFDLDLLRQSFPFDDTLVDAVRETFARRGTPIPTALPMGLSDEFVADQTKKTQWRAFIRKTGIQDEPDLGEVINGLRAWLWPVLQSASKRL